VHAVVERQPGEECGFPGAELRQACIDARARKVLARELDEERVVAGFARDEVRVEAREGGVGVVVGEEEEALEAARFDQGGDQQTVEEALAHEREEAGGVGVRGTGGEAAAAERELAEDERVVRVLLAGDVVERADERRVVRVPRDQRFGRARGAQLAVRLVDEQRERALRGARGPGGRRARGETHGISAGIAAGLGPRGCRCVRRR
jgi:hypothetical protein